MEEKDINSIVELLQELCWLQTDLSIYNSIIDENKSYVDSKLKNQNLKERLREAECNFDDCKFSIEGCSIKESFKEAIDVSEITLSPEDKKLIDPLLNEGKSLQKKYKEIMDNDKKLYNEKESKQKEASDTVYKYEKKIKSDNNPVFLFLGAWTFIFGAIWWAFGIKIATMLIPVGVVIIIPLVIYCLKLKKKAGEAKTANEKIEEEWSQAAKERDQKFEEVSAKFDNCLNSLKKEYLKKIKEMFLKEAAEKAEETKDAQAKIKQVEEMINDKKYDFYSVRLLSIPQLLAMANIYRLGRANSYQEALNICLKEEADERFRDEMKQKQEEMAEEQRRYNREIEWQNEQAQKRMEEANRANIAEQRRHNQQMEQQAEEQSRLANEQKQLAEQKFEYEKKLNAKKEAQQKSKTPNPSLCATCHWANSCAKVVCHGYMPNHK